MSVNFTLDNKENYKMMKYRPEIDGLRAISIIPVLLFHAGSETFRGGFIGVDVFFVISGYLITSIILQDLNKNTFSMKSFYERRARRILPSLFVVMSASVVAAIYTMGTDNLYSFFRSLTASSSFLANMYFYRNIGYFDTGAGEKPLLHLWSLAVEEQFYIVFPLLMFAIRNRSNKARKAVVLMLGVASLVASVYIGLFVPALAFYSTPLRGWELLTGSYAAMLTSSQQHKNTGEQKRNILGICGLVLIFVSMVLFEEDMKNLGAYTIAPVFGAYLIIVYGGFGTSAYQILSQSILVKIGLASYSIYLWHQPLFAYLRITRFETPKWEEIAAAFMVSIALGYVSWRWVETPFRDKRKISARMIFLFSGVGIIAFIAVGLVGARLAKNAENRNIVDVGGRQISIPIKFNGLTDTNGVFCSKRMDMDKLCVFRGSENSFKDVVIVGDSHARVLSEELEKALRGTEYNLIDLTASGCPLFPEIQVYSNHEKTHCTPEYQKMRMDYLLRQGNVTVIMASRLPLYINGTGFDNTIGGKEDRPLYYASKDPYADINQRKLDISNSLNSSVQRLVAAGAKVILVKPVPTNGWNPITRLKGMAKKRDITFEQIQGYMSVPLQAVWQESLDADLMIDDIAKKNSGVSVVETKDIFCDSVTSKCSSVKGDVVLYADIDHLSASGNKLVVDKILNYLR